MKQKVSYIGNDLQDYKNTIKAIVSDEISAYLHHELGIKYQRTCPTTGNRFVPKHRYHFFSSAEARKAFYSGWFRPRKKG